MYPELQVLAFLAIVLCLCLCNSKTFLILFASSVVNMVFYWVTTADTHGLIFGYSVIDTVTALMILRFGDKVKLYQVILLLTAVSTHYLIEVDLTTGSSAVYDIYFEVVAVITILQMIGAGFDGISGFLTKSWRPDSDRAKHTTAERKHCKLD